MADDKVIVVVDGFFTQAGAFNVNFAATRGTTTETASVNMDADIDTLPVDIAVTKQVKPKIGGSFGSTATVPFGGAVTYKLTVKNLSAPDPVSHSTDVYLGKQLWLQDMVAAPSTNDVNMTVTAQNFQCTAYLGAVCLQVPTSGSTTTAYLGFGQNNSALLINPNGLTYPVSSTGFLPAGGSFDIIFDAVITTSFQCSPGQNNKVFNSSYITYSNGTTTLSDIIPGNNTSSQTTVTLTGLPTTCPPPPITVTKTLLSPVLPPLGTAAWGVPFTYLITITNNSGVTLSGLGLKDMVGGSNTPAFTANFSYSSGSNPICSPACISTLTSAAPLVGNQQNVILFQNSALFAPLAPGATQTLQYQVQYNATCTTSTGASSTVNYALVTFGAQTVMGVVATPMSSLSQCQLTATKTQTSGPTSFSSFPVTLGYHVEFKNNSPIQTVTVGTLIDAMALDSAAYASKLPIDYSYTCTATGVVMPTGALLNKPLAPADIQATNPLFAGVRLIDFSSSNGTVFSPNGVIACDLSVTLKQPPTDDSLCQGDGNPGLKNSVFMHLSPWLNTNQTQPTIFQQTTAPLPKCVSIVVGKTVAPSVVAGGPVTFTVTIKNAGNDHVSNVVLNDTVPPLFTNVTRKCLSGCTPLTPVIVSNTFSVPLSPIGVGATATVEVTANAPTVLGSHCNTVNAAFNPFPLLTYFEGNQAALTTALACVQVTAPPPSLKKKFLPSVINIGQPVQVAFTLINPTGGGAQSGLGFSDSLPVPPFTTGTVFSNTCGGTASVAGSVVTLQNGALPAGPSSCTVVFSLAPPTKCGTFQNTKKNIVKLVGLDASSLGADLTVNCGEPMKGTIQKIVLGVPANFAGTFNFNVVCTPPGGTPTSIVKTLTFTASDPLVQYKSLMSKIKTISMGLLAPGTTCTVTEIMPQPPAPPGCAWQPPTYGPPNGTVTAIPSGPVTVNVFNRLQCDIDATPKPD
jgi:uncharacterized repeat protein (TIGR01451 family)